jgi:DNA-binding response OmpR family regulator
MKLLLADSDQDMVEVLSNWLKMHGYEVRHAFTADRLKSEWMEQQPDLVILDPAMRNADGLEIARELQRQHDTLLLIMSGEAGVQDEVRCLESGADDYLRKPFFPVQMLARIKSLSRRSRVTLSLRPSSVIQVGPLSVDSMRNVVMVYGKTIRLTPTQSRLLQFLAVNANDVCPLEQIVQHVWGYDDGDTYLIKAHIRHLREKIEPDPSAPRFILTVAGVGYTLSGTVGEAAHAEERAQPRKVLSLGLAAPRVQQSRQG